MPTRRTLLLADDSPTIRKVISLTFEDEGLRVVAVGSGGEALAQLEQDAPDIVLADVHMPAPNGYEVCARVKRDGRLRGVPVMLLVGAFEPFDEAEARRVGADEVLTKPFQSIRELVSKVGGLLGGHPEPKGEGESPAEGSREERREEWGAARQEATPPAAVAETETPAPAFDGLDFDDESIETASADSFAARARAAAAPDVLDVEAIPFAYEESAHASLSASPLDFGEASAPAPVAHDSRSFAAAASGFAAPARPAFDARPPAEDSLLDLDDVDAAPSSEVDDLVLDMGEEPAAARHAPEPFDDAPILGEAASFEPVEEAAPFAEVAAPFAEPPAAGVSPANLSSAWQEFGHDELPAHEDAGREGGPADFEAEETTRSFAPADFSAAPTAHAGEEEAILESASFESDAPAGLEDRGGAAWFEGAAFEAGPSVAVEESPERGAAEQAEAFGGGERTQAPGDVRLSQETIDAIARRVVEQMSERVLREIAWEVVPDMAERLIRRRLEEQK